MCGSLRIMPRTSGVSTSSISRCILFRPSPISVWRWSLGRRIGEPIWRILIVLPAIVLLRHRRGFDLSRTVGRTAALDEVRHLLSAALRDRLGAGLLAERLEGRAAPIIGVGGADRLGHNIGNAHRFKPGAHRAAGDDAAHEKAVDREGV